MDEKESSSSGLLNPEDENNDKTQTIDQVLSDCTIEPKNEDLGECSSTVNEALEVSSTEITEPVPKTAQEERYLALRTRYTEKQLADFRTEADTIKPKVSSSEIDDSSTQLEQKSDTPTTATTPAGPSKPRKTKYSTRNYRSHNSRRSTSSDASSEDSNVPDNNNVSVRKREKRARTTSRNAEPVNNSSSSSSESDEDNNIEPEEMCPSSSGSSSGDDSLMCSTSSLFTDEPQSTEDSDEGSGGDDATVQKIKSSKILSKIKPKYTWKAIPEIYYRELGLSGKGRRSFRIMNGINFQNRLCGSLHPIERLELMYKLQSHEGCVNSLNFNRSGSLLVSGSDDLKIIVWKWASNDIAYSFNSGHTSNVFQTKFLDLDNQINIVSSARDGQIRYAVIPPSGGDPISTVVIKHLGAVHKIALTPNNPYEVLTAGEDGHVIRCDLRDNSADRLVTVRVKNKRVPLYSIASHPIDQEFCVSGRDQFVRIYDRRNCKETLKAMAPAHLIDRKPFITHITCAVYNYTGSEILASYSDEDIYLFDNQNYSHGSYLHKYQGHNNSSTIKGVNFFGPKSEFIMSGSDCANCFFWDKNTEAIVQWIAADENGVVNCLEPHPQFPMLATSGLDHDIKIWVPSHEKPSIMEGLKRCIQRNISCRNSAIIGVDLFDDQTMNIFVRQCLRNRGVNDQSYPNIADIVSSDEDDDPFTRMDHDSLPCSPS